MYYMGLLLGTNLFGIQDAMSLYSLCIGSIFRIHLKVAISFRLLSNHDWFSQTRLLSNHDPIFSWQQNSGKIECFSFQKLHQTSQIAFILLLVLSWTDNHGQSTWFAWLPQANFASLKLHAASYLSGNTWAKSREGGGSPQGKLGSVTKEREWNPDQNKNMEGKKT